MSSVSDCCPFRRHLDLWLQYPVSTLSYLYCKHLALQGVIDALTIKRVNSRV